MAQMPLPPDFKEFLALLNSARIEYLVIGGYAVAFHGHPRPTGDLDIWVAVHPDTARQLADVCQRFGFTAATPEAFAEAGRVIRMGNPPVRLEVITGISGVAFGECHARGIEATMDGVPVRVISLADLIANKRAAGRHKDLSDVEALELAAKKPTT